METMSASSSTNDELILDSLKDLKNLRAQLYSAAEYFELSYTNDDQKQIVVDTLKDYAAKALVNAVDHLGSVTCKVNGFVDEKVDEVSETEFRVSSIEQRLRTCQVFVDREGLSQQSLVMTAPKYHKRYILPGKSISGSGFSVSKYQELSQQEDNNRQRFQTVSSAMGRNKQSSTVRKERSPSPSSRLGTFQQEKRATSPWRASSPVVLSGSFLCRPATPTSPNKGRRHPLEPRKSTSMRVRGEKNGQKEVEEYPNKSKRLFKALLSRRKPRDDEMLYSYLDEY